MNRQYNLQMSRRVDRRCAGFAGLCLTLVSLAAVGDRANVNETLKAESEGFVHIRVIRGDLEVIGWERDEVRVTGKLDARTREFIFEVNGNDTEVNVRLPRSTGGGWGTGSDLTIHVPEGSSVEVSVVSTDTQVENIRGGLELGAVSGDVRVRSVNDRLDLTSVSGEVDLRDITGRIRAKSVSGDLECSGCSGEGTFQTVSGAIQLRGALPDLELESVSGDIEVESEQLLAVDGHSVSGDVEIAGRLMPSGTIEFDTVSGNISLKLPDAGDARYNLQVSSGEIRNRLTDHRPLRQKYGPGETLKFVSAGGGGEVVLRTGSGNISLGE